MTFLSCMQWLSGRVKYFWWQIWKFLREVITSAQASGRLLRRILIINLLSCGYLDHDIIQGELKNDLSHCSYLYSGASARKARQQSTMGKKIGNPSRPRRFWLWCQHKSVRPSVHTSVQTQGEGEGRLEIFLMVTHTGNKGTPSFLGGFLFRKVRKTLISICHVNKRSERLI